MQLHERAGQHVRDGAFDGALHRLGLAGVGASADDGLRPENLLHRHRERVGGHVVARSEPTLADLLVAALVIERNNLVGALAVNVGRRIVEREVTVFTDADTSDVDRGDADKRFKTGDFSLGIGGFAVDLIENLQRLRSLSDETLAHVAAEGRLVLDRNANILVEMEAGNLRPVDAGLLDERLEELELARAGGDDDARFASQRDRFADSVACRFGGVGGHIELVLAYVDFH